MEWSFIHGSKEEIEIVTLKKNLDFARVFSKGKWASGKYLVIYYKKNYSNFNKIGISVNKKVRTAVLRNRAKRVLREVYRLNEHKLKKGYDIVIYCKDSKICFGYDDICSDYLFLLNKSGLGEINE